MKNLTSAYIKKADPRILNNSLLLVCVCILIFIVPIFPVVSHKLLFNIFLTVVFLTAVLAMEKNQKIYLLGAVTNIILEWIANSLDMQIVSVLSSIFSILFFTFIVVTLIVQIAKTKRATIRVIMEAINGYLLLGIVFALLITLSMLFEPRAFSFVQESAELGKQVTHFGDYLYHAFVNYTTLGYGDITPQLPFAKSLAILMSVSGQIYLAVIIAMLVGKYVGSMNSDSE